MLLLTYACGAEGGCNGCQQQPIPGGFPAGDQFQNAIQVRLSKEGVSFISKNFDKLMIATLPGGLTFDIPPSGCQSDNRVCCNGGTCQASLTLQKVSIEPSAAANLKLDISATVKTTKIQFKTKQVFTWWTCDIEYDSTDSSPSTLGLKGSMQLKIGSGKKLEISSGDTTLQNFECGDIRISGSWYCSVVDFLCPLLEGVFEDQIKGMLNDTVAGLVKDLPTGQESRFDLASFMKSFSPKTEGAMDYLIWGGSYAKAENSGISVGAVGGFRPATPSPCVEDCSAPGAACAAPPLPQIALSSTFSGNQRPDGKSFHVGIGVDKQTLTAAAYAMYGSGALCLDVGTSVLPQLSSDLFSLLVPSLSNLTTGQSVPITLAVRPGNPPEFALGKGTYHQESGGKVVIDDPLIKLSLKEIGIDVYANIEQRPIRLFTVRGDLILPILLFADAKGALQPILGDLNGALTNVKIENNDLISESPEDLAKLFPTLLGLAAGFLGTGFEPIPLPEVSGMRLALDEGSITTVDQNQVLAIFAELAFATATKSSAATKAEIVKIHLPETDEFAVSRRQDARRPPSIALKVNTTLRPRLAKQEALLEWTYRINGGFYQPWRTDQLAEIHDPRFWLQGIFTIDVISRVQGRPETIDPTPVRLRFAIDTVPPKVRIVRRGPRLEAEVYDAVSPKEEIALRWRIDGQVLDHSANQRAIVVGEKQSVELEATDWAGNRARSSIIEPEPTLATAVEPARTGQGCSVSAGEGASGSTVLLLLALVVSGFWRRARGSNSESTRQVQRGRPRGTSRL
jgi:MYXO-CTERM domain-containing protein